MAMDFLFLNLWTILLSYSDDEDSISSNSEEQQPSVSRDADYLPSTDFSNHITEGKPTDLIRDLKLTKNKAELLASRLQQWNLLHYPPLHIKLGLMKNSVKVLSVKGPAFTYLCRKFPRLTFEKVKAVVFNGPQIRQLFKDQQFEAVLSDKEKAAWQSLEKVSNGFLGNFSCKFQRNCTRSGGFV